MREARSPVSGFKGDSEQISAQRAMSGVGSEIELTTSLRSLAGCGEIRSLTSSKAFRGFSELLETIVGARFRAFA